MARFKKTARKGSMAYVYARRMVKGTGIPINGFRSSSNDSEEVSPGDKFLGEPSKFPGETSKPREENPEPEFTPPHPNPPKEEEREQSPEEDDDSSASYLQEFKKMGPRKISPMEKNLLRGFREVIYQAEENQEALCGQRTDLQLDAAYIKTYLGRAYRQLEKEQVEKDKEGSEASVNHFPKTSIEEDPEEFSKEVPEEPKKDVPRKLTAENDTSERRIMDSIAQLGKRIDRMVGRCDELRQNQLHFQAQVSRDLAQMMDRLRRLERASDSQ